MPGSGNIPEMRSTELVVVARAHIKKYRAEHPDKPLPPEVMIVEQLADALDEEVEINLRCEHAIHEQIKLLESILK